MEKGLKYPKRLIEVDLPIKRISSHARREKSIRHGHISTLHIWWARRPLAACRAVLCASLWIDPADELCPKKFIQDAKSLLSDFATKHLDLVSKESYGKFNKIKKNNKFLDDKIELRNALLDFIADFANWDNSINEYYIDTSRKLTQSAHESLGGENGTRPMVVDSFAGGGAIPLEALRIGADTFASDLNPVAVLLNKVILEYIPKYGQKLAEEVKKWGIWINEQAEKELEELYPKDADGSTPIAYLWARTVKCEGPGCGAEVPLIRSLWLAKKTNRSIALKLIPNKQKKRVDFEIINNVKFKDVQEGTVKRGSAICPNCNYITPVSSVRKQLSSKQGGAKDAKLFCIVLTTMNDCGRKYRLSNTNDIDAFNKTLIVLSKICKKDDKELKIIPDEILPVMSGVFNAPLYGHNTWGSLFTSRQSLSLITLIKYLNIIKSKIQLDNEFSLALLSCLALTIDKVAQYNSSLCRWKASGENLVDTFGRQALPMVWDFAESNIFGGASGDFKKILDWVIEMLTMSCAVKFENPGSVTMDSALASPLPNDVTNVFFTDPPYYNAVPYADLSDFFYVWLKRSLSDIFPNLFKENLSPKKQEICEMSGWDPIRYPEKDGNWYEERMRIAMSEGKRILKENGIAVIVFAHKSTKGWESQLQAMLNAGFVFTGSWPIDTEMGSRLRAMNSAALASSIHLVCRPRIISMNNIGDWVDILRELPIRIHKWMPRLTKEGIVGADAIFACLGPALEIFSKYESVEKTNGENVTLNEYLEHVWAAVSKEALNVVFKDADTKSFEEDSRITAIWLWTLLAGKENNLKEEESYDESVEDKKTSKKISGYTLEYDTARKIAQGLGANLVELNHVIEIKGDKARLLPVSERMHYLFGQENIKKDSKRIKNIQENLFEDMEEEIKNIEIKEIMYSEKGKTVLDKLHQSMLLFQTGRTEALKRFLVEDGIGKDERFWKLAQALSALYPRESDEKRWVDGVQTYKKNLGF